MKGQAILQLIQEVEGVIGSFVASPQGELLGYLMPSEFGEQELRRTCARLHSIVRCAELCELGVEQCELRLQRYLLLMTRFEAGTLNVLVELSVSRRALAMATQLALQDLPVWLEELERRRAASSEPHASRSY